MEQEIEFDFNEVLEQFKSGKNLTGGLLAPLITFNVWSWNELYRYIISYAIQIYQVSISTATISTITDKIISKVKDGGKYVSKAVYTILGVGMDGKKDILGLYLSESGWIKRVS